MSSRNRLAALHNALAFTLNNHAGLALMRHNLELYGYQARPLNMGQVPLIHSPSNILLMEQKVTTQHSEIQKLLTENQQIAVTHVALRQELAAAQQEIQRMPSIILGLQK